MKTLTRYFGREVLTAILLIFSALVALFEVAYQFGIAGTGVAPTTIVSSPARMPTAPQEV